MQPLRARGTVRPPLRCMQPRKRTRTNDSYPFLPPALSIQTSGEISTLAGGLGISPTRGGSLGPNAELDLERPLRPVALDRERRRLAGSMRVNGTLQRRGR